MDNVKQQIFTIHDEPIKGYTVIFNALDTLIRLGYFIDAFFERQDGYYHIVARKLP